jgi:hypothetical protein
MLYFSHFIIWITPLNIVIALYDVMQSLLTNTVTSIEHSDSILTQ